MAAYVAKGFALFGQQKYASAVHSFNVALRECDVRDRALVSLVKVIELSTMYASSFIVLLFSQAIVLFEVGYHAESMAEIADLIEHCPVEARSACSAAQASVSKRLAWRSYPIDTCRQICILGLPRWRPRKRTMIGRCSS